MDPNLRKALEEGDLEEVIVRAASFARTTLTKYFWRGFRPNSTQRTDVMPDGQTAEDFVSEALERLLEGRRSYNLGKSLLGNINSVTESLISSAKKSSDRKPLSDYPDQAEGMEDLMDPISSAPAIQGEHGHEIIEAEILGDQKRVFENLMNSLDGDDEAEAYLGALSEGFFKSEEIADVTGIPIKNIYELRRRIKKHAKTLFDVQNFAELKRKLVKG